MCAIKWATIFLHQHNQVSPCSSSVCLWLLLQFCVVYCKLETSSKSILSTGTACCSVLCTSSCFPLGILQSVPPPSSGSQTRSVRDQTCQSRTKHYCIQGTALVILNLFYFALICFSNCLCRCWWVVYQTEVGGRGRSSRPCRHGGTEELKETGGERETDIISTKKRREEIKINLPLWFSLMSKLTVKIS